jgi:hypothetical protein
MGAAGSGGSWRLGRVAGVLIALACAGCGNGDIDEDAEAGTEGAFTAGEYVADVEGSDAFVAFVTDGSEVRAYVCDGHDDEVAISEWFKGTADGGSVTMTSTSGDAVLEAAPGPDGVSGSVEADGETLAFEALPAEGDEGLYAFKGPVDDGGSASDAVISAGYESPDRVGLADTEARGGWVIIIPEGTVHQRGAVAFGTRVVANTALDLETNTATIAGTTQVTTGRVTADNLERFFTNGWP